MANYSRNKQISGVKLTEESIHALAMTFSERFLKLYDFEQKAKGIASAYFCFTIYFDSKVYKLYSVDGLIKYFRQANSVEKITFTISTLLSDISGRKNGSWMELNIDEKNPANSYFTVSSDENDWLEASWISIQDILNKCKNKHMWLRTSWTTLVVQLLGVMAGGLLSLWIATKISPKLALSEGKFTFGFICAFILFSNVWSFVWPLIIRMLNFLFPDIKFVLNGKVNFHWGIQAVISAIVGAVVLYFFSQMFLFAFDVLNSVLIKK